VISALTDDMDKRSRMRVIYHRGHVSYLFNYSEEFNITGCNADPSRMILIVGGRQAWIRLSAELTQ